MLPVGLQDTYVCSCMEKVFGVTNMTSCDEFRSPWHGWFKCSIEAGIPSLAMQGALPNDHTKAGLQYFMMLLVLVYTS